MCTVYLVNVAMVTFSADNKISYICVINHEVVDIMSIKRQINWKYSAFSTIIWSISRLIQVVNYCQLCFYSDIQTSILLLCRTIFVNNGRFL